MKSQLFCRHVINIHLQKKVSENSKAVVLMPRLRRPLRGQAAKSYNFYIRLAIA